MSISFPKVDVKLLLQAGSHFGHRKRRWNPKMAPFIYGSKGDMHIINLDKTKQMLEISLRVVADTVKSNGKVLFVGTKKQASAIIEEKAKECGQFYVNHRWLGGMLTNNLTVSNSIKTMESIEAILSDKEAKLTKKEKLSYARKLEKLYLSLNGVRNMKSLPDLMVVADTNKEIIAIKEAAKLGIPVVGIVDTNATLENVKYPIPANDDSIKSLSTIFSYISEAIKSVSKNNKVDDLVKENFAANKASEDSGYQSDVKSSKIGKEDAVANIEALSDDSINKAESSSNEESSKTEVKTNAKSNKSEKSEPKAKATKVAKSKDSTKEAKKPTAEKKTKKSEGKEEVKETK
jgi:small subunit ribosomal protein S2